MLISSSTPVGAPRSPHASRRKALKTLTIPIETDAQGWILRAHARGSLQQSILRGTVLAFQFYGVDNKVLDAPDCGHTYSAALESRFHYIPVGGPNEKALALRPLLPPRGAIRLEAQLLRWQGTDNIELDCTLSADPHEYTLNDLPKLEAHQAEGLERIAWRWLDIHRTERQYLLEVQALAWRTGATALLAKACRLLETAPEVRGYMRLQSKYALAAIEEISDWLPLPPNLPRSSVTGLAHNIVHLSPAPDSRLLALARLQFEQGLKPLVLVPVEYTQQAQPAALHSHSIVDGVDIVELNALAPAAWQTVNRPDLLRFDVLLSSPWLHNKRSGLIHAHVGRSGYDLALRALALSHHHRLPVVMQWHNRHAPFPHPDPLSPPPTSAWADLAYKQQMRCARRADALLVADNWQAALLEQAGIPRDRIFVLPPCSAKAPPADKRNKGQWTVLLDVHDVAPERITMLTEALPQAIKLDGLRLRIEGDNAAVAQISAKLMEAELGEHLHTTRQTGDADKHAIDVTILLRLQPCAGRHHWLSGLGRIAGQGTLMLAEHTQQSECLVSQAGLGLTFDIASPASMASALASLAPSSALGVRLREQLRISLNNYDSSAETALTVEAAYRYALCAPG